MNHRRNTIVFLVGALICLCKGEVALAQHKSISYGLLNEVGTYKLISLTFSHELDNDEGITYVIHKQDGDTVYHIDQFLNGWVAMSNDGQTIAHLVSEKNSEPLPNSIFSMYRNGKLYDSAKLNKLIHYELQSAKKRDRLSENGWLRNDSIYHKMATHPFYITDDKVFMSFDNPKLSVFDMNQMFHIYTGNGANHFLQNYYSLPNAPFRTEFDSDEYFPSDFPKTKKGKQFVDELTHELDLSSAIPEEAKYRVEIEIKLNQDGSFETRKALVYDITTNQQNEQKCDKLRTFVTDLELDTSSIPPHHPTWIFNQTFWLK